MWGFLTDISNWVNQLYTDYTTARAAKIDNLDAAITTRAPASTAVSTVDLTPTRAAKLDNLDAAISAISFINSIQTGYVSVDAGSWLTSTGEDAAYVNVTISAVVLAKSIVIWQQGTDLETGGMTSNRGPVGSTARLTSTTNLRVSTQIADTKTLRGRWQVVEYK